MQAWMFVRTAVIALSLAGMAALTRGSSQAEAIDTEATWAGFWYAASDTDGGNSEASPTVLADGEFTLVDSGLPALEYTSAAWGDYDNDGDLDILLEGYLDVPWSGGDKVRIYRNVGNGLFVDAYNLPDLYLNPAATWGDYDNDGWLDYAISYEYSDQHFTEIHRNNRDGTFTPRDVGMYGVQGQPVWGDYDDDGRPDLLIGTRLYRNNGNGTFSQVNAGLPVEASGSGAWGDYDNDDDLDILLSTNTVRPGWPNELAFRIFRNNGDGSFADIGAGLPDAAGSVAWGDYDNDARLDVLIAGVVSDYERIARVYHNNGDGTFTDINAGLPGTMGSAAWGDFDNDGDLDIGLTGATLDQGAITRVYRNDGGGVFVDVGASLQQGGTLVWGDFENDGRLDILLTDGILYRNNALNTNSPPSAPFDLAAVLEGRTVHLTWSAASDALTSPSGLTYNLRVGTGPGAADLLAPIANTTVGWRRVPQMGNVQTGLSAALVNLKPGRYYWSVQAVDTAFAGGEFASEASFVVPGCYLPLVTRAS